MNSFCCPHCAFSTSYKSSLQRHIESKHTKRLRTCTECGKRVTRLDVHMAREHPTKVLNCDQCNFVTMTPSRLLRHKAAVHMKKKYTCQECGKVCSNLSSHMYKVHGKQRFQCHLCTYASTNRGTLASHLAAIHDVGKHTCDFCLRANTSAVELDNHSVCRRCFRKATGKNSRVEKVCADYLQHRLQGLLSADRSMASLGGCSKYRPDMLWVWERVIVVLEVDEHQHAHTNGAYTCEERRLSDIVTELVQAFPDHSIAVVRWNPDAWEGGRVPRTERLEALLSLLETLREAHSGFCVYYMYYNQDNPRLVQNLPRELLPAPQPGNSTCDAGGTVCAQGERVVSR